MSIWALIPVKPLALAKSRLSKVMTPAERETLSIRLLGHVLDELAKVPQIERRLVVSRDPKVLRIARQKGAFTVQETEPHTGLNPALERASAIAESFGIHGVLILPMDLPLLRAAHVQEMIAILPEEQQGVVIVPDRHGIGTNALLMSPPRLLPLCFGRDSLEKHRELGRRLSIPVTIAEINALQHDLDFPEDLELLFMGQGTA